MGRIVGADRFSLFPVSLDGRVVLPKRGEGVKSKRDDINIDKPGAFLDRACRWGLQIRSFGLQFQRLTGPRVAIRNRVL